MTALSSQDLEQGIRDNYRLWNEGQIDELQALFRSLGPNGFTIEHIGSPPMDGAQAIDEMWSKFCDICKTELQELIVNGNEGAAYVHNNFKSKNGIVTYPSLETYKVEGGKLIVRYYHKGER